MSNKTLLVTGGSSDIAEKFIRKYSKNYDLIITTYNKNYPKIDISKKKKIKNFKVNFNNYKELCNFTNMLKKKSLLPNRILHIASNKLELSSLVNLDWKDYEKIINVQVRSLFEIFKYFLPSMKKNKEGKIVILLSSVVYGKPPSSMSQYVTAKYALNGLIKSAASEFANYRININSVSPDMMKTKFMNDIPDKILQLNEQKVPFGRNTEINDILDTIEFLLSKRSDFITGIDIPITGGL